MQGAKLASGNSLAKYRLRISHVYRIHIVIWNDDGEEGATWKSNVDSWDI